MALKKVSALILMVVSIPIAFLIGCDTDSYGQRTVVYVSNVNEGSPYFCDVLNQGDSLYYSESTVIKYVDDYIEEDWITVEIYNKPYNSLVNTSAAHGDFLVTGYEISYSRTDGGSGVPVQPFTGSMSTLIPAGSKVQAVIVAVPYEAKNDPILSALQYSGNEIFARADITFHGHEVQTDRNIDFSASFSVNFGDELNEDGNSD